MAQKMSTRWEDVADHLLGRSPSSGWVAHPGSTANRIETGRQGFSGPVRMREATALFSQLERITETLAAITAPGLQVARAMARLDGLSARVQSLEEKLSQVALGAVCPTCISSFADEPYDLIRPIPVTVQEVEEGVFVATFLDANVSMTGETLPESVRELADYLLDLYDRLNELSSDELGPGPSRQLAVLNQFISAR
jgi:hypothetical protein